MKKNILLFSIWLIISVLVIRCTDSIEQNDYLSDNIQINTVSNNNLIDYYWYKGEKVSLRKVNEKKFILFKESAQSAILNQKLSRNNESFFPQEVTVNVNPYKKTKAVAFNENLKWTTVETEFSAHLKDLPEVLYEAPYFSLESGEEVGISHLFYVKLKDEQDISKLEDLATLHNIEILGNNEYMPLWYTLACSKESTGNTLELANKFYETNLFDSCEPDFLVTFDVPPGAIYPPPPPIQIIKPERGFNDEYAGLQWNISDERYCINIYGTKKITQGSSNIIVAVIDRGVQLDHPDLNIYSKSYDTQRRTSPSQVYGGHGTACAGIISAKTDNFIGIAGIAPYCPVMSISHPLTSSTSGISQLADGFNYAWQNGASVISNSWGLTVRSQILDDAISNALTKGREGKGCVVVFAVGNSNKNSVSYPANSHPDILAVGATNPCGERKRPNVCEGENWGSNYGEELDVMAPGVLIPTTDLTEFSGNGYNLNFSGTSAACPHAAGVAALILSIKPNYTQNQVTTIIKRTALRYTIYHFKKSKKYGKWHEEMGYGIINAYKALQAI